MVVYNIIIGIPCPSDTFILQIRLSLSLLSVYSYRSGQEIRLVPISISSDDLDMDDVAEPSKDDTDHGSDDDGVDDIEGAAAGHDADDGSNDDDVFDVDNVGGAVAGPSNVGSADGAVAGPSRVTDVPSGLTEQDSDSWVDVSTPVVCNQDCIFYAAELGILCKHGARFCGQCKK